MPKKTQGFDFEGSIKELGDIVEKMEGGELSLEESLHYFERGIALTRSCQKALSEAEQKVKILMEKDGAPALRDFAAPESGDANT